MKIASFTMMRDEAAILNPFIDQLSAFFDYATLVDHGSVDRSVAIVRERRAPAVSLLHLKASGFPQDRIATLMIERIFRETDTDWLLFIDCDEFLPFPARADLEAALERRGSEGYCFLNLANIVPSDLNGGDIFARTFKVGDRPSSHRKIMVSRSLFEAHDGLRIVEGCEACASSDPLPVAAELSERALFHIPITSTTRFVSKIKANAGHWREGSLSASQGCRPHWIDYHRELSIRPVDAINFFSIGLTYAGPNVSDPGEVGDLDFRFPYVRSQYEERPSEQLTVLFRSAQAQVASDAFVLQDEAGTVLASQPDDGPRVGRGGPPRGGNGPQRSDGVEFDPMSSGQIYNDLVESLFTLPSTMPETAWHGHIPFLMMLIKSMRPDSYAELGTHFGARAFSV